MKYRVVSVLKDNRPRFLIISDIEEIEILPSKYLKHLDQINASPNTVKSAAFALSYYYNYLQEQTIGLDEITLLSYSEQNKHFIDFLYWVKSGKHTEHNTQTSNKTCDNICTTTDARSGRSFETDDTCCVGRRRKCYGSSLSFGWKKSSTGKKCR